MAWAGFSLFLSCQYLFGLYLLGFPDGYLTPYQRQTEPLRHVLAWLCVGQTLYFLIAGLRRQISGRLLAQIAVAAPLMTVPMLIVETCPDTLVCAQAYEEITGERMDDGAGG